MTTYIATTAQPGMQQPVTVVITNPETQRRAAKRFSNWQNHPQTSSLAAASVIFIAGGMDFALGLGWNLNTGITTTTQFQFSWFVGFIVGALLSSFLTNFVPKRMFYGFSSLLLLIAGIIFTAAPYKYEPIIAARYLSGIGLGFTTVPFIIHAGEISVRSFRGTCTSYEQYGLSLGIAIQMIYASQWTPYIDFAANRLHGILEIIFAVIALFSSLAARESPVFFLRQNREAEALAAQRSLIREVGTTEASQAAYDEHKCYVIESTNSSMCELIRQSMLPFVKLLIYRCFVAFSFSLPLSLALYVSSNVAEGYYYNCQPIIAGVLRMLGSLLAVVTLDSIGRKLCSVLALLCMCGLILGMAGIFGTYTNILSPYYMSSVCQLSLAFSFFAGLFAPSTTTFLSEAFPMRLKSFLIMLCVCIEQVIHIIVVCTFKNYTDNLYAYLLAVGIVLVFGVVTFAMVLPETRGITLREAGQRFTKVYDIMAY